MGVLLAVAPGGLLLSSTVSQVVFEGNEGFTQAQLVSGLHRYDISLQSPIERTTADDAAFFIADFLQSRGFPEATVEYDFRSAEDRVVFRVFEGPRFFLRHVTISGGEALPTERVSAIFQAQVRQETHTPLGRLRYVQTAIEGAENRVREAYAREGYLQAAVSSTSARDGRMVDVAVAIDQGERTLIDSISFPTEGLSEGFSESLRASVGSPYRPGDEILLRSRLLDGLRRKGFFDAVVSESVSVDGYRAFISLQAEPGRQYRLGKISVQGNQVTRTAAIMKRLGLKPGQIYDSGVVDDAIRRLWFSSAFENVEPVQTPTTAGDINLDIRLQEGRAKQISATVGYGQWIQGFLNLNYVDRNFLGTLNRFEVTGMVSFRNYGAMATLSDPWFLGQDAIGSVSLFFMRTETPAYRTTYGGGALTLQRKFNPGNTTGWAVSYEWRNYSNTEVFGDTTDTGPLNYTLGSLSFRQTLDKRNDILSPMKGYLLSWEGGLASEFLGGNVSFGAISAQATWYQPLREIVPENPFVPFFVLNHRVGLILPYGNTSEVPVQERFFLGGPESVRSFQLDGMGPRDRDGDPVGGLASFLANAELQWPVWRALYLAAFVDVGNLAYTLEDFSFSETRIGVGLGARFYTPLGAVRVDYGANMIRGEGDPFGAWQFGFGFTF